MKRMQRSLSWIEWFDRLNRVLEAARADVRALARSRSPKAAASIELCKRQLIALTHDLRLLDRGVLPERPGLGNTDRADNLQRALDTAVFQLASMANAGAATPTAARERLLVAIDLALGDSAYEAAELLSPSKRRA
jgi:hypothetical protein